MSTIHVVISADGNRRREVEMQASDVYVRTVAGETHQAQPTWWFTDTNTIAHTRDGRVFTDPVDGVIYTAA